MKEDTVETGQTYQSLPSRVRLADQVAEQLERSIVEDRLEPGAKLPTEAELCEQFNVSRTVTREAVNSLVARGLVETRRGVGTTVLPASRDLIVSSLTRFLNAQNGGISFENLHEVRGILEVANAQQAASRATEEDITRLRQIVDGMYELADNPEALAAQDADFHRALAEATHNPRLVVLLDSIRDLLQEYILSTLPHIDVNRDVFPYHESVLAKVAAKDKAGAGQAMWEHITQAPWEIHSDPIIDG